MTPEEKLAYNAQLSREQHQAKQVKQQQQRDRQIPPLQVQSWDSDRGAYRAIAPDGTVRYVEPLTNGAIGTGDTTRPGQNRIDGMPHKRTKPIVLVQPENIVAYGAIDTSPTSSTFNYDIVAIYSDWKRYKRVFSLDPDEFVLDIKIVNQKPYVLSRLYTGGRSDEERDHPWHFYLGSKSSKRVFNWVSPFEDAGGAIGNSAILIHHQIDSSFPNSNFFYFKTLDNSFEETGNFSLSGASFFKAALLLDIPLIESSIFDGSYRIFFRNISNTEETPLLTEQQGPDNQSLLRFAIADNDEYFVSIKRFNPVLFRFNATTKTAVNLGPISDRTTYSLSDTSIYKSGKKKQYFLLSRQGDVGVYQFDGDMTNLKRLTNKPFVSLAVL